MKIVEPQRHRHTARLCLRAPAATDRDAVIAIHTDPETNRHNPAGPATRTQAAAKLDAWVADWDHDGIGYWVVRLHGRPDVLGVGGIRSTGDADARGPVYNLYYRFRPSSWGMGFARELAHAAIDTAAEFGFPATISVLTTPDNRPALRVARAVGLTDDGTAVHNGGLRLRLTRPIG